MLKTLNQSSLRVWSVYVCVCMCCLLSAEFGDYDITEHATTEYIAHCKMLPKETSRQQGVIADIHRTLWSALFLLIYCITLSSLLRIDIEKLIYSKEDVS